MFLVHLFCVFLGNSVVKFSLYSSTPCGTSDPSMLVMSLHLDTSVLLCHLLPVVSKDRQHMADGGERRLGGFICACVSLCYIVKAGIALVHHQL